MGQGTSTNPNEWATTWVTTTTAQDDGKVQVEDENGTDYPVPDVDQLGLPGHYAQAAAGARGYMMRLERGGVIVATYTDPPSDAVDGEAGMIGPDSTSPVVARVLPGALGDFFEVTGGRVIDTVLLGTGGVTKYVARNGDVVATPLGVSVGTVVGSTVKVKAG